MSDIKDMTISLKVSSKLNDRLVLLAYDLGVTKSEIVRRAVTKYKPTKKEREAAVDR